MKHNSSIEAFFLLVRAGLFGRTEGAGRLLREGVDWAEVYQLAKEQSVVGLVAEGIETLQGDDALSGGSQLVPKEWSKRFFGTTLRLEQRNLEMNKFIAQLIGRMRNKGIYALLLKGQGVAQCYTKPLWRTCGDVDLLLNADNYQMAKDFLMPYASTVGPEHPYKKHLGMVVSRWMVELHGRLRCGFSSRVDRELDNIYKDAFCGGNVTSWMDGNVQVFMLGRESNVVYVFVHFLNHFYKSGVGIRQLCDWCRLLWTSKDALDTSLLASRLKDMGLMRQWRAFASYAVEYLGMPQQAMPFHDGDEKWKRKARYIHQYILKTGNMGHNRDKGSKKAPLLRRKLKSATQRAYDLAHHLMIFPADTMRFLPSIFMGGLRQK